MERLAEQIVAWHNRHPLARRITLGDVHTIGVVALPFVRASAQAGGLVEPVLTDSVGFDELLGTAPVSRFAVWQQRLARLAKRARRSVLQPRDQWRAFNEKFLPGLSPRRVEQFALAHGFAEPPATPETRPWRVIVIDDKLASARTGWPFELYLTTAGIDAGSGRSRVLAGRGIPSQIIGRRLWDPKRVVPAAGVLALLLAAGLWALWPRPAAEPAVVAPPAEAASAAQPVSAAASAVISEPAASAAALPASGAEAALASAGAASAAEAAASEPGEELPPPDIRPRLVQRTDGIVRPPLRSSKPAEGESPPTGKGPDKTPDKPAETPTDKPSKADKPAAEPADARLARLAKSPDKTVVALVGPPGTKAEAEALLKKMQASLAGVHSDPDTLQADVIQTPDGWRATVWPFPNREQAQLINATLIARGMKTKAVNF